MEKQSTPYSALKIFYHTDKIKNLIEQKRSVPLYIRIKPTNVCNMKCFYCSYSKLDVATNKEANYTDFIEWEVMERIINDLSSMGVKAVTYSGGGDPLCYKYIEQTLNLTLEKNLDLSIITNGLAMEENVIQYLKHAKWVRISLDAANPATYAKIRNIPLNSLDKVFNNIINLRKQTADCEIGINYVINHMNYNEIYDIAKKAKQIDCNHIKFAARILTKGFEEYHKDFKNKVIEMLERAKNDFEDDTFTIINRYEADFEYDKNNTRKYSYCAMKELTCVIAADNKVYFCHDKAYKPDSCIGNLIDASFPELWFSEKTIDRYKNFDAVKECIGHCVYDERNILINSLLGIDKKHINFI